MNIRYKYDQVNSIVYTTVEGELVTQDIIQHFQALLEDESIQSAFVEVVDLTMCSDLVFRASDIEIVKVLSARLKEKGFSISFIKPLQNENKRILNIMMPLFSRMETAIHICESEEELNLTLESFKAE